MLDILLTLFFCWLGFQVLKLTLKVAWGTTKIIAAVLFGLAVPGLILCLIFAGGILLLLPVALVGIAFALLKACV